MALVAVVTTLSLALPNRAGAATASLRAAASSPIDLIGDRIAGRANPVSLAPFCSTIGACVTSIALLTPLLGTGTSSHERFTQTVAAYSGATAG